MSPETKPLKPIHEALIAFQATLAQKVAALEPGDPKLDQLLAHYAKLQQFATIETLREEFARARQTSDQHRHLAQLVRAQALLDRTAARELQERQEIRKREERARREERESRRQEAARPTPPASDQAIITELMPLPPDTTAPAQDVQPAQPSGW